MGRRPHGGQPKPDGAVVADGAASTWTDRIGGIVLERVGTISGVERELARDPYYYFPQ